MHRLTADVIGPVPVCLLVVLFCRIARVVWVHLGARVRPIAFRQDIACL